MPKETIDHATITLDIELPAQQFRTMVFGLMDQRKKDLANAIAKVVSNFDFEREVERLADQKIYEYLNQEVSSRVRNYFYEPEEKMRKNIDRQIEKAVKNIIAGKEW